MIKTETIEEVRLLSLSDVIDKYGVTLKKVGNQAFVALSPFTEEKTPSFRVNVPKNYFKCFSTGKGGDAITFVREKEGLSYVDAVKDICGKFGIKVQFDSTPHTQEQIDEIELLYRINQATANKFAQKIDELMPEVVTEITHPAIIELIQKRRFTPETIAQWQIGFAPGDVSQSYTPAKWNFLSSKMIQKGYYKQGVELGLIKTKDESVTYDVFRNRIMFPILDHNGRYCGFGGRALQADQFNAKYINSPDSKLFNKSRILFGLNHAIQAIRKRQYAILMEGYTDVISFHQAGQTNSVGTCGTALTEQQAKMLRNYTNKVVLINDPDEAGQNASARAINILMALGIQCSVVPMPSVLRFKSNAVVSVTPKPDAKFSGIHLPKPREPKPGWNEMVFITDRKNDIITYRSFETQMFIRTMQVHSNALDGIDKIDPDELVRMF